MKTIAFAPFAALAVMAAQPAAAEVVEQSKDHFVTRSSATVKATPRQTWLALIEPAKWWNKAHTWSGDSANLSITPQGGGCFCERIPEKDTLREVGLAGSAQHMVVVQAKPMEVLRMRGVLGPLQSEPAEGVLTIAMQPVDGGTKIVWEYIVGGPMRYEIPTIAKAVDGVLAEQLGSLADLLGRLDEPAAKAPAKPAPEAAGTPDDEPANVEDAIDAMGSGKKPKSD
jgi:uncharacterized protein YndB with AHSA1/START domain